MKSTQNKQDVKDRLFGTIGILSVLIAAVLAVSFIFAGFSYIKLLTMLSLMVFGLIIAIKVDCK